MLRTNLGDDKMGLLSVLAVKERHCANTSGQAECIESHSQPVFRVQAIVRLLLGVSNPEEPNVSTRSTGARGCSKENTGIVKGVLKAG